MRLTLLLVVLALVAVGGYAWKTNPDGCRNLGADLIAIFHPPADSSTAPADSSAPPSGATTSPPSDASAPPAVVPLWRPVPIWHAPAVLPAQPNWTWTALDGTTYQNVVVTNIEPDTVTITHSLGVAHLPIANLPADIQKLLGYDAAAAEAMKNETERENEHPYYLLASVADAQAAARQLHRPLAWLCSGLSELSEPNPTTNTSADLTQMAVNYLKTRAIVIFVNGNEDLAKLTWPVVRERQFFKYDDGAVPGGHHFMGPKIVFTDPDITEPLGRATYTEMFATREAAIEAVLNAINNGTPAPVPVAPAAPPHL